jgi:KR domain/Phosphopantetheine attachment site
VNNMTYDQWRSAVEPKVNGTWNLHSVLGDSLDFFILLSSVAGMIGSSGQGNYCAGNAFQDSFARYRASLGLPVRTIDVGLVEGEGYTADNETAADFIYQQGIRFMKLSELFAVVNHAIAHPVPDDISTSQAVCGVNRADPTSDSEESGLQRADPRFSHMWSKTVFKNSTQTAGSGLDVRSALKLVNTPQEATDLVQTELIGKLGRLLAMPLEDLHADRSVASYGVDSLIAVELRNWLSKQLETHVQIFELLSPTSITQLAGMIARRSRLVPPQAFQET